MYPRSLVDAPTLGLQSANEFRNHLDCRVAGFGAVPRHGERKISRLFSGASKRDEVTKLVASVDRQGRRAVW